VQIQRIIAIGKRIYAAVTALQMRRGFYVTMFNPARMVFTAAEIIPILDRQNIDM
jgi:hypothetical protein